MDDFVSIVDSKPENEIPKQIRKQSKILFIKGLLVGAVIALCIGGMIQFIMKDLNNEYLNKIINYFWFGVNEWTWLIGFVLSCFIIIRNILGDT